MSKNIRLKLLRKCGLPDVPETSHCFSDSTHHTCCLLGPKSREYADNSGNPIGKLSVQVQSMQTRIKKSNNKTNNKKNSNKTNSNKLNTRVPWCTCTGSKVCSYYSSKFGNVDGTRIKFIGNLKPSKTNKNKTNRKGRNNKTKKNNNSNANSVSWKEWNEDKAIEKLDLLRHQTLGVM